MKIVIDENIPLWEQTFGSLGEVVRRPGRQLTRADLMDADALIVRSVTRVSDALLEGTAVKFLGTCTIGRDHIDQAALQRRGIAFADAAGCNANAVAEYAVTALLAGMHCKGRSLLEASVGIVGFGRVGQALYSKLRRLGVRVLVNDPPLQAKADNKVPDAEWSPLETLLEQCEVISMHTPLTRSGDYPTHHLLNESMVRLIRPGTFLLNAGRGEAVATTGLLQRMVQRGDLHLILDVWEHEPDISIELLRHCLFGTPHIAGYSWQGKVNGTLMIERALRSFYGLNPAPHGRVIDSPQLQLSVVPSEHFEQTLATVTQSVYSITEDDQRMREALQVSSVGASLNASSGSPFDHLRKTYQTRLEWHQVQLSGTERLAAAERAVLKNLGFQL